MSPEEPAMQPEIVVDTHEKLVGTAVERFERMVRDAVVARGLFSCALPGGSVAETLFPAFAVLSLPWRQVHVFFGDERAVPPTDPDSNYGLARRLWLERVPARVHPMLTGPDDLDAAAAAYANDLRTTLGDPPRLDLALLGMGPDGHVCSLFPNRTLPHDGPVAVVRDSPKPPPTRLTLTMPVLAVARAVWVVAFGASKAPIVREAVEREDSKLPVAMALRSGPPSLLLLDPDAASALGHRP
jgi:6-phosphogluconolactonase